MDSEIFKKCIYAFYSKWQGKHTTLQFGGRKSSNIILVHDEENIFFQNFSIHLLPLLYNLLLVI